MHILTDTMRLFGGIPNTVEFFLFFEKKIILLKYSNILFSFQKSILVKESPLDPWDKQSRGQIIKGQINVQFVLILRFESLLTWQQNAVYFTTVFKLFNDSFVRYSF